MEQKIKFYAKVFMHNDLCVFLSNECKALVDGEIIVRDNKLEELKVRATDIYDEKVELKVLFTKGIIESNYEEGLHSKSIELDEQIMKWGEKYLKINFDEMTAKIAIEELLEIIKSGLKNDLDFEEYLTVAIINLMKSIIIKSEKNNFKVSIYS